MNAPFFVSDESKSLLYSVAESWLGTPFHPHAAIKGVGVDCFLLAVEIYRACGVIGGFEILPYSMTEGQNLQESKIVGGIAGRPEFMQIPVPPLSENRRLACCNDFSGEFTTPLLPGDAVFFRIHKVAHHCGVVLGDQKFVHVYSRANVNLGRLDDPTFSAHMTHAFRPVKL